MGGGGTIHVDGMYGFHIGGRAVSGLRLPRMIGRPNGQPFVAPSSVEEVERYIRENDVEFLFAQFVDMHGKPNAKLVPGARTSTT